MYGVGRGWWVLISIGIGTFWAHVIFAIVTLLRSAVAPRDRGQRSEPPQDSPLDTLKRRLASGEISVEEREERRSALDHKPCTRTPQRRR